MRDPLEDAAELFGACAAYRDDLRLVGGLAVRLHVGTSARQTVDVDVVAMTEASRNGVLEQLQAAGYRVGESGGWWRAARREAKGQRIVDVGPHPVVNPRTLDTVTLKEEPLVFSVGDTDVRAVGVNDLTLLKLVAGRDQDVVDVMLLSAHASPAPARVARNAELDDVERIVSRTAAAARAAAEGTRLELLSVELLGRPPTPQEIAAFSGLLQALKKEGL